MNHCRLERALESAAAVMLLGLMLLFPQQVVQGAQEGLRCCAEQLIPALLPFLIICQMVVDCPAAGALGRGFLPYLRLLGISAICRCGTFDGVVGRLCTGRQMRGPLAAA